MRVAIFSNTYYPTVNGVAKCVEYYEQGLRARGHEVVIFAPAPEDHDPREDPDHVYRFPSLPIPLEVDYPIASPYSRPVSRALRHFDFDIIHTQHPFWVGAWGASYARRTNTPVLTTVHTEYRLFARMVPLPTPWVESYLEGRVTLYCNRCDLVATPVASMREYLQREGVRTPIEIVPNPTQVDRFAAAEGREVRERYGWGPEHVVLGFVGRLSPEKNLGYLMEAVAPVLRHHPQVALLLVGDGPEKESLRRQAQRLGLTERIVFAGSMPHERVPQYQAAFDLFVTASRSETQPLAYTEAMACGKPVVAVEAPGARDMIQPGSNGLLAPAGGGPAALTEQIQSLVEDPQRRRALGEYARQWAQQFSVERVAERLEQVYTKAQALAEEEPI